MFQILLFITIFLTGLAAGSFLNSIIYRLQTGAPHHLLLKSGGGFSRSYCPHCKKTLGWQDLIPLLSFLFLKGKCRYCQAKISWQYPLVELSTGFLFSFLFYTIFQSLNILTVQQFASFFYLLIISCFLIVIFVYDLKHYIIPDKVIYPAIALALIYNVYQFAINNQQLAISSFLAAIFASVFFLAIVLISGGRWMGWGDPKLAFFMGLLLGFPNILVALFIAFLIGAIIGIGLIIFRQKTFKSEVPFGPFLVAGTLIALFWGKEIIGWYLHLLW